MNTCTYTNVRRTRRRRCIRCKPPLLPGEISSLRKISSLFLPIQEMSAVAEKTWALCAGFHLSHRIVERASISAFIIDHSWPNLALCAA